LKELTQLEQSNPANLSLVLMAGYLTLAEQLAQSADPSRAAVYTLALRGLSRFLPDAGPRMPEGLVWSQPVARPTGEASRNASWFTRIFGRLLGLGDVSDRIGSRAGESHE